MDSPRVADGNAWRASGAIRPTNAWSGRRSRWSRRTGCAVPFDRNKIKTGLEKACWKRPIRDAQLEAIVSDVENHVETHFEIEVESRYLGELVMQHLRDLDQVAYVRFASVYRQFEDVHDFVDELKPMLAETPRPPR